MGIDWVGYGIFIAIPLGAVLFFFYQQFLFELVSVHFGLGNWGVLAVIASISIHYIAIMDPFEWTKKKQAAREVKAKEAAGKTE